MTPAATRRTVTLEDVAKEARVSRATVSRVVNGNEKVDQDLARRVVKAIASTGYIPNAAARTLVNRRTGTVALVMSGSDGSAAQVFADPFFGRITGGVVTYLRDRAMHPTLMLADSDRARRDALDFVRRGNADGALLVSTHAGDPLPQLFVDAGVPAVLFARPALPVPISFVDLDHEAGAALAANHLAERGCRQVATIAGPADLPAANSRLAGFQRAMARHGVPFVQVAHGNFTADSGEQAMIELLTAVPEIDGVFAANDLMAVGALRALRDHGRVVPDDVALIGFDDSEPARLTRPRLTTISQPVEEMAARMTAMLLTLLDTPGTAPSSVVFDPYLVARESA
ncbi:LacI family DNA-binding transcriptional regulator [Kribbella albertanoniae]|uniref:LacI family transcriptional regulator n=1 Tax=Kribbella albertanoniae TaxID=1266829 RepID=A0A4R4PU89_9ACTN|nr:LacI family DNA-binding transcriptional regulator [Kribbella albertanoniae]TDC25924.1 LacI family transcriptional regulator [Kribbella albertanoniae]